MKNQRSSISQTNSLLRSNISVINEQKDSLNKNLVQTNSYRIENIDRNALIKRQDMEICLKRLSNRTDVYGIIVATMDGRILYDCESLRNWIPVLTSLSTFARHLVRNHDPNDNIQALRLKTKTYEMIITIRNDQLLIAMQMLSNRITTDITANSSITEDDWEVFLRKIREQQKKLDNE